MIRKEDWMFKGAIVNALGKKATITKMDDNSFDGNDYVYRIYCKVEGKSFANPYHPTDVKQIIL